MAASDEQIRAAIKDLITNAYGTATVFKWNALSHRLDEWPGMLRATDFATSGKTHGWVIKRSGAASDWKGLNRDRTTWIYDVWGFYGFRTGNEASNSDDEFSAILQTIYYAVMAVPTLNVAEVEGHELLQWDLISTVDCGEETLHWAKGRLKVRLCCSMAVVGD